MGSTYTPNFEMRRADIYKFVGNDPRTVSGIESLQRLVTSNIPSLLGGKVDETRMIISGAGLTGGGSLATDLTLNVGQGTGIRVDPDTINIADTTVTAGSYGDSTHVATFTVNQQGQLTAASSDALKTPNTVTFQTSGGAAPGTSFDGSAHVIVSASTLGALTANQTITLSGDATGSGSTGITVTLANSGVTAGSYTNANITVNSKGLITLASNGSSGGGSAWDFSPPTAASFTAFSGDATTPTLTDDSNIGLVLSTSTTSGGIIRGGYKALPAGDFSLIMKYIFGGQTGNAGGLTMYESATGKAHSMFTFTDGTQQNQIRRQTIGGTYSADQKYVPWVYTPQWVKMARSGTTLTFSVSQDGKNWFVLQSIAQTTYLTTAPDRIGPALWVAGSSNAPTLAVSYWSQSW